MWLFQKELKRKELDDMKKDIDEIKSLLKETSIPRSVAEKITQEVEEQIKDAKISFLTTGLIRELVNAKGLVPPPIHLCPPHA